MKCVNLNVCIDFHTLPLLLMNLYCYVYIPINDLVLLQQAEIPISFPAVVSCTNVHSWHCFTYNKHHSHKGNPLSDFALNKF